MNNHNADINNFKYAGDEIKLLGDNIPLSINEANYNNGGGYLCSSLSARFDKVQEKAIRWQKSTYFPNVFARSMALKTFLIAEFQYLLSNASLSTNFFDRTQKQINKYVNKKRLTKSPTFF